MPESVDFHTLFRQLQARYPTASLVSDLVQIHAEHFVVRTQVQISGVTLATGMAAAATIEQAEDHSRLRVLTLLGITPAAFVPPLPDLAANRYPISSPLLTQPLEDSGRSMPAFTTAPLPEDPPLVSPALDELPKEPLFSHPAPELTDFATASFNEIVPVPETEPFHADWSSGSVSFQDEDGLLNEIGLAEGMDEGNGEVNLPATIEPPPKERSRPTKSRKTSAPAEPAPSAPPQPDDRSELIAHISVEIDRIGWSKRRGSEHLQQTYGKKTRSELDDEELLDFLHFLKALPSSHEVPFAD